MIKLKLKRKVSGRVIRNIERQKRLQEGEKERNYQRYLEKFGNKKRGKRHVENPNIYEGEEKPKHGCGYFGIRLPKKKRKTAWKRFKKNFPYVKPTKHGTVGYVLPEELPKRYLEPELPYTPKKKIN